MRDIKVDEIMEKECSLRIITAAPPSDGLIVAAAYEYHPSHPPDDR
jgi:hypothetical protein